MAINGVMRELEKERKDNTEWFAANAVETSMELGQHMVQCALESLEKIIV